ncbi:AbrB/MazE/SpoVT family DNA-binding domain-containing protein [Fictibacillus phosphorivorans]|uniref:AbrB/MazE/SpoVT family DNA-binding domain-containing protein n=1 Tax=Fictibacillus phosphorivorans TaxID=1221500 RepID=UPI003CF62A50
MGKALGIVRKLDELGRIVLPKEVRSTQNWPTGTPMEMLMTEQGLLIRKYQPASENLNQVIQDLKVAVDGGKVKRDSIRKAIEILQNKR